MKTKWHILIAVITGLAGLCATLTLFAGAGATTGTDPSSYTLINSPVRTSTGVADALRAEWEARGHAVTAQTVFPPDDRIPVPDTTVAPWRDVVSLLIKKGDSYYECSGAMLSANAVLTAAHCLFDAGQYMDGVLVVPGSTATSEPYGHAVSNSFAVPVGWANGVGQYPEGSLVPVSPYDFGIIILSGAPFANALQPYMTIANVSNDYLSASGTFLATAGFPGDKEYGSMWFTSTQNFMVDDNYICTDLDLAPGQSGSPIIAFDPAGTQYPYVFSVVSVGDSTCNTSVRFTSTVLGALNKWCAADGCTIQSVYLSQGTASPSPSPTVSASATPAQTPSPSPTLPSSPTPTATASPTPPANPPPAHSHTVSLSSGVNLVAGPQAGSLSPAAFVSCLPAGSWTAVYVWDPAVKRWFHLFAPPVPSYANSSSSGGIDTISQGEGAAILVPAGQASRQVVIPDDQTAACA